MPLKATSTGNAGFLLENAAGRVYIDSFFGKISGVGGGPILRGAQAGKADLILITHAHPDHLDPAETLAAARASGAIVAGPAAAIRLLAGKLPPERLLTLEPPEGRRPPAEAAAAVGKISLKALRTYHASGHNSYLLEMDGVRILHDADNEHASRHNLAALGRIDLLLLCPWAGSGAGEFVAALRPGLWALIHLTDEEIDQHRAGDFLPGLIQPVPPGVAAPRGGESLEI
ncbi:MAG: MBL fold metallo-hydrolase [Planctomycetota bacterium]|jgi:L-ascorbate metabolism protein UlaG (beta-lactamase superfamily)|nr:MBL fold metallo-hydrolase [Planctomycetota bacterium]